MGECNGGKDQYGDVLMIISYFFVFRSRMD